MVDVDDGGTLGVTLLATADRDAYNFRCDSRSPMDSWIASNL